MFYLLEKLSCGCGSRGSSLRRLHPAKLKGYNLSNLRRNSYLIVILTGKYEDSQIFLGS